MSLRGLLCLCWLSRGNLAILILPAKNVPLAEWFNRSRENGDDEGDAGALYV